MIYCVIWCALLNFQRLQIALTLCDHAVLLSSKNLLNQHQIALKIRLYLY